MLGHISFGVSDLAATQAFYDAVMPSLGWQRVWTHAKGLGYGPDADQERLNLFVQAQPTERLTAGPGFHLAFDAPDRAAVDAFHAAAVAHGGTSYGEPGPRPHYSPTYYAAFIEDPDGHRLEVVHQ